MREQVFIKNERYFPAEVAAVSSPTGISTMSVILVTGGNRGIGYAIVKVLSDRLPSATFIIGCRDTKSGEYAVEQLRGEGVSAALDVVRIDIEDDGCIRDAVVAIDQKYGKLDCGLTLFRMQ